MDLGNRVRKRREELNMSQEDLSLKMGYKSRSSINKIENGRAVTQKIILRLAESLKTTPAYLMGWEDDEIETSNEIKKESDDFYDDMESKMSLYLPEEEVEIIKQYRASDETTREIIRKILSITKG